MMFGTKWPSITSTMDPVGAGLIDRADFIAEVGEIGGEDRRGDAERARMTALGITPPWAEQRGAPAA